MVLIMVVVGKGGGGSVKEMSWLPAVSEDPFGVVQSPLLAASVLVSSSSLSLCHPPTHSYSIQSRADIHAPPLPACIVTVCQTAV